MSPKTIRQAVELLRQHSGCVLACHLNPDGDGLGSLLGLSLALEAMGKRAVVYSVDGVPEQYRFLPASRLVSTSLPRRLPALAVVLDCDGLDRVGPQAKRIGALPHVVDIDHHATGKTFGNVIVLDPDAGATGEIVYRLLREMAVEITPDIATNLYTAIVTDTGRFSFDNTRPQSLRIAADLLALGADRQALQANLYESRSLEESKLIGYALSHLRTTRDRSVIWVTLSRDLLTRWTSDGKAPEGTVNQLRAISDAQVAMLLTETAEGKVRVSLRSKGAVDVAEVALHFGGGGHPPAAGCTLDPPLRTAAKRLLAVVGPALRGGNRQAAQARRPSHGSPR